MVVTQLIAATRRKLSSPACDLSVSPTVRLQERNEPKHPCLAPGMREPGVRSILEIWRLYLVFGAGGGGGTGDILTDDQDYKLRGLTELQTDQTGVRHRIYLWECFTIWSTLDLILWNMTARTLSNISEKEMINLPDFHLNGRRPNAINDINNPLSQERGERRGGRQFDQLGWAESYLTSLFSAGPSQSWGRLWVLIYLSHFGGQSTAATILIAAPQVEFSGWAIVPVRTGENWGPPSHNPARQHYSLELSLSLAQLWLGCLQREKDKPSNIDNH